jgi:uncharacterized membrane protein YebE (DUF533 family)
VQIGTIGSARRADVLGGGVVVVNSGTPDEVRISWWIGGDDRWYMPDREITTRQSLVRNTPIVSTAMRVPSGDVVVNCFGAVQSQRELCVIDIDNRSKVPFVCALVMKGPGVRDVTLSGSTLKIGGFPILHLAKPPTRMAAVEIGGDLEAVVTSGEAGAKLTRVDGLSEVAVLFPVTHGTTVRSGVLLGVGSAVALVGSPVLSALGEVHNLANGWQTQMRRAPALILPDRERTQKLDITMASVLLASEPAVRADGAIDLVERAELATALASGGFEAESGALLEDIADWQKTKGGFETPLTTALVLRALGTYARLSGNTTFADTLSPAAAGAAEFLLKNAKKSPSDSATLAALWWAGQVFGVGGDRRAAEQCVKAWRKADRPWPLPAAALPTLPASSEGGVLVAPDQRRLIAQALGLLGEVARFTPAEDGAAFGVDLLSGFEPGWRGQNIEIRNIAVPGGRLSYAVRWHGQRVAILWDIVPVGQGADIESSRDAGLASPDHAPVSVTLGKTPMRTDESGIVLSCRSLDPNWSATSLRGEGLLVAGS